VKKVLALDYGAARTGVAVSDPTGTIARPLGVVEYVDEVDGFARLLDVIRVEDPDVVLVGMPLTLKGDHGEQARATEQFVESLRAAIETRVETLDERFTTRLAERGGEAAEDARAAAHLLAGYLERDGS
jgi:putative Holliday junction resolvase